MEFLNSVVRHLRSLKVRVALAAATLFLVGVVILTAVQLHLGRSFMVGLLTAQQNTLVARMGQDIDDKLRERKEALATVAEYLGPKLEQDTNSAPLLLKEQKALGSMFDVVFLFAPSGAVLASEPDKEALRKLDVSQREYFIRTLKEKKGLVSKPYKSLAFGRPFIMMTVPIFSSDGTIIAVAGGAIDLLKPNFLGALDEAPVGRTGYFYIFTHGVTPVVLSHPIKSTILAPATGPALGSSTAAALGGFEGTVEATNNRGERGFSSYKRLKEADWLLASFLPTAEAFEPVERAQEQTLLAGLGAALLMITAVWLIIRHCLHPLDALQRHVRLRIQDPGAISELQVTSRDEIGQLTTDFNRLMVAQANAEKALAKNEILLRTITDNVPVLIGNIDKSLRYQFVNKAFEEWFGIPQEEITGRPISEILGAEYVASIQSEIHDALEGYAVKGEREIVTQGRTRYIETTYLPQYGENMEVLGFYVLVADITDRKATEVHLDHLAHHDTLTSLLNRRAFNQRMELSIDRMRRTQKPAALMYLDIDHFKGINDTYGHAIGDKLLVEFSTRLLAAVRSTDLVGRFGGDEFVVFAEDLRATKDAYIVAQKIVDAMRVQFNFDEAKLEATTSVGVALCDPVLSNFDATELFARADAALYEAKKAGRNTFKVTVLDSCGQAHVAVNDALL